MTHPIVHLTQEQFLSIPFFARLKELPQIPSELYYQGIVPELTYDNFGRATPRILTIIGSRKNSPYGKHVVETLIKELRGYPVIILSGLAYGIDSLAHKAALTNTLKTIAIPGSGLHDTVLYPSIHRNLRDAICDQGGLVLSESKPTEKPAVWSFPKRNRLMASLADAVLVIEAQEKSGTLVTARQGLELGKDIGAIPGDIFSPNASGTNMLVHEGAYLIRNVDDILDLLHLPKKEHTNPNESHISLEHLSKDEQLLLTLLHTPCHEDTLLEQSNLSYEAFSVALSSLEINNMVTLSLGEVRRLV